MTSHEFDRDAAFQSRFSARFERPFPQQPDANIQRFARAFERQYSETGLDVADIVDSYQLFDADGDDLDRIGARFGTLGRRRGRGDQEYRRYLASLEQTFRGRGTSAGIAFAVAAGVGAGDTDDVAVVDYPTTNEYGLVIHDWAYHSGTDVRYLANLADPSGVSLRDPVEYQYDADSVDFAVRDRQVESTAEADDIGFVETTRQVETDSNVRYDQGRTYDTDDSISH